MAQPSTCSIQIQHRYTQGPLHALRLNQAFELFASWNLIGCAHLVQSAFQNKSVTIITAICLLSRSPIKPAAVINVCNEQTCEHSRMTSITRCSSYANVPSRNRQTICTQQSLPVKCEFSMHKKYSNVGLCMKEESNMTTL